MGQGTDPSAHLRKNERKRVELEKQGGLVEFTAKESGMEKRGTSQRDCEGGTFTLVIGEGGEAKKRGSIDAGAGGADRG